MQKVLGIGGFFFRAKDPGGLADWYARHLGIDPAPGEPGQQPWRQAEGPTVFAPFPTASGYFPKSQDFMLNFRVADLEAMLAQLSAAGVEAGEVSEMAGVGSFARIHDPEGNPIELWQAVSG